MSRGLGRGCSRRGVVLAVRRDAHSKAQRKAICGLVRSRCRSCSSCPRRRLAVEASLFKVGIHHLDNCCCSGTQILAIEDLFTLQRLRACAMIVEGGREGPPQASADGSSTNCPRWMDGRAVSQSVRLSSLLDGAAEERITYEGRIVVGSHCWMLLVYR